MRCITLDVKVMNHPLTSLTEQEIFNEAYYGMHRQLEPEYIDEVYRSDEPYDLDEAYYLDTKPDAVLNIVCQGHEAPSEWRSPEVDQFWKTIGVNPDTVSPERKTFLALLRLTDNEDTEDDPMEPLRQFARSQGLQIPSDLD
jgi:hypothetical protein